MARQRMKSIALAAAVVMSCGSPAPPSIVIPLGTNDFGEYALLVFDATGLVIAGRAPGQPPELEHLDGVVALPERQELDIGWIGSACAHRPTLHVSGTSTSLRLEVSNPTEPQLPFFGCPAVGIQLAVTLSVSEPVAQAAVTLEVTD